MALSQLISSPFCSSHFLPCAIMREVSKQASDKGLGCYPPWQPGKKNTYSPQKCSFLGWLSHAKVLNCFLNIFTAHIIYLWEHSMHIFKMHSIFTNTCRKTRILRKRSLFSVKFGILSIYCQLCFDVFQSMMAQWNKGIRKICLHIFTVLTHYHWFQKIQK